MITCGNPEPFPDKLTVVKLIEAEGEWGNTMAINKERREATGT